MFFIVLAMMYQKACKVVPVVILYTAVFIMFPILFYIWAPWRLYKSISKNYLLGRTSVNEA